MNLTSARKLLCLLMIGLGVSTNTYAQFTLTGEIRPGAEFRDGFKTLNIHASKHAFFIEQRSRLYLGYRKEKSGFQLSVQDVRIWGNADQIYKTTWYIT